MDKGSLEQTDMAVVKVEEAQRLLSLSRAAVYKLMDDGQLSWVKIGRARRIPLSAIRALIERNTVGGPVPAAC